MNQRAITLSITLFVFIVVGMFAFTYLQKNNTTSVNTEEEQQSEEETSPYAGINRIEAKHFYIDGVHTIVGELAMPTPCDLLDTSATVAESYPEQITFNFDVINNAEFCAQVVTPQRFKISASASEEATFTAVFEGREVELNLIEAAPGETPEDFELFLKG